LPPTGALVPNCNFTGLTACQQPPPPPPGQQGITDIKTAVGSCQKNGTETITYTVTVLNTGTIPADYSTIKDTLDSTLISPNVSSISNGGTINGNIITWPGGNLAAGASLSLTYMLIITTSQVNQYSSNGLQNTVLVNYSSASPKQVSYTYYLTNFTSSLPCTGLDNNQIMYIIAISLFITAVIVYVNKYGSIQIANIMVISSKRIDEVIDKTALAKKRNSKDFERKILQEDQIK